jgi:biotin-[acetyl-CoA-carboxylase] ligase BirA-like protein
LALAHALTDDLDPLAAQRLKLKWPNDMLLDGKKMGGILIETLSHQADFSWVVIGVGINYLHDVQIDAQLGHKTAALVDLRADMDSTTLLAHLVTALAQQLECFETHGFTAIHDDWQHYDAYLGQNVHIYDGTRCLTQGTVMGVDHLGQLQLQTISGIISIAAGEVSLRCNSI